MDPDNDCQCVSTCPLGWQCVGVDQCVCNGCINAAGQCETCGEDEHCEEGVGCVPDCEPGLVKWDIPDDGYICCLPNQVLDPVTY